jgi:hypothetical protein
MSIPLTEQEKQVYNTWLRVTRQQKQQPFTPRKKFDDLKEEKCIFIQKISRFFDSNPTVKWDLFFQAPFRVFKDGTFDLEFFTTRKAVSCYISLLETIRLGDIKTGEIQNQTKQGIKTIFELCKDKSITFEEYKTYFVESNTIPDYIIKLKDGSINFYCLHLLNITPNIEKNILEFIIPDFYNIFQKTKIKFLGSGEPKETLRDIVKKLELYLLKNSKSRLK